MTNYDLLTAHVVVKMLQGYRWYKATKAVTPNKDLVEPFKYDIPYLLNPKGISTCFKDHGEIPAPNIYEYKGVNFVTSLTIKLGLPELYSINKAEKALMRLISDRYGSEKINTLELHSINRWGYTYSHWWIVEVATNTPYPFQAGERYDTEEESRYTALKFVYDWFMETGIQSDIDKP